MLLLFSYAPILKQVYLLREILTGIFERPLKKSQAEIELNAWVDRAKELELNCFDSFVVTNEILGR